jgi:hypothetical protein
LRQIGILAGSLLAVSPGLSQLPSVSLKNASGIYISKEDFMHSSISMLAENDSRNGIEQQLDRVVVIRDGKKQRFNYHQLSGYYQNGFRYRAYGDKWRLFSRYGYYQILDDSGLIIYSRKSSNYKSGGYTWYYYSISIDSPVRALIRRNILKDFHDQPEFADLVISGLKNKNLLTVSSDKLLINELYRLKVRTKP